MKADCCNQRTLPGIAHCLGLLFLSASMVLSSAKAYSWQQAIKDGNAINQQPVIPGQDQREDVRGTLQREDLVLDIRADGRTAAILRSNKQIEVINTKTGAIQNVIPLFTEDLNPDFILSDDGKHAWARNAESNSRSMDYNIDQPSLDQSQDRPKDPQETTSFRDYLVQGVSGVGLYRWNLSTGELIQQFQPEQRGVKAFDVCTSNGREILATSESPCIRLNEKNRLVSSRAQPRVAIYSEDLQLLGAWMEFDEDRPLPTHLHWVQGGKSLLMVQGDGYDRIFTLLDTSNWNQLQRKWSLAVSRPRPAIGTWETEAWCVHDNQLFVYQSGNVSPVQAALEEEELENGYRLLQVDIATGRVLANRPFPKDRPFNHDGKLRMSVNKTGYLAITGLHTRKGDKGNDHHIDINERDYGSIVMNTNSVDPPIEWYSEQQAIVMGDPWLWNDGLLLSPHGIYSIEGIRKHFYHETKTKGASDIEIVDGLPVLPSELFPGNVVASLPDQVAVASPESLDVLNLSDAQVVWTAFRGDQQLDDLPGVEYDIQDAIAAHDPATNGLFFALPHRLSNLEEMVDRELASIKANSGDSEGRFAIPRWQLRSVVRNKYGRKWELFYASASMTKPRHISTLAPAVWVGLAANLHGVGCSSFSAMDRRLILSIFPGGKTDGVTWIRPVDPIPPTDDILEKLSGWMKYISWEGSTLQLRSTNNGFLLMDGSDSRPGTGPPALYEIDLQGTVLRTTPMEYRIDAKQARQIGNLPAAALLAMQRLLDPIAIDITSDGSHLSAVIPDDPSNYGRLGGIVQSNVNGYTWSANVVTQNSNLARNGYVKWREVRMELHSEDLRNVDVFQLESDEDYQPYLWMVDETGEFAFIRPSYGKNSQGILHLPSMTYLAHFENGAPVAFDRRGFLITNNGAVSLHDLRLRGVQAIADRNNQQASEGLLEVDESWEPVKDNQQKLFFLALASTEFEDQHFPDLDFCRNDVHSLARSYRSRAEQEGMAFRPMLMTTPSVSAHDFEQRMLEIIDTAQPEDEVVIVCATHGVRLQRGLYLMTAHSQYNSPQGTAIGWPTIAKAVQMMKARRVTILLDTCHAASFSEDSVALLQQAKLELSRRPGLTVLASCGAGESAYEIQESRHGAFTDGLLKSFASEGAPGEFSDSQLQNIIQTVKSSTEGRQTPVVVIRPGK